MLTVSIKSDLSKINAELKKRMKDGFTRSGVLEGATYTGEDDTKAGQNVAEVAFWNEFGTEHIPARPALRNAIELNKGKWTKEFKDYLKQKGSDKIYEALEFVGMIMRFDLVDSIKKNTPPELAESTIMKKEKKGYPHAQQTLIASGTYAKSISYDLVQGKSNKDQKRFGAY